MLVSIQFHFHDLKDIVVDFFESHKTQLKRGDEESNSLRLYRVYPLIL
ncbi:hypothetical protein BM1374165_00112 [Bartonella henselae]|uniref:Uncharacterized protein n=1 Tax=Bartonella henselae TaxID=38323 RepID=X5MG35_BARHN|nr:hypothetical protein BM1374165_00112 [Bartonella henselae]